MYQIVMNSAPVKMLYCCKGFLIERIGGKIRPLKTSCSMGVYHFSSKSDDISTEGEC